MHVCYSIITFKFSKFKNRLYFSWEKLKKGYSEYGIKFVIIEGENMERNMIVVMGFDSTLQFKYKQGKSPRTHPNYKGENK